MPRPSSRICPSKAWASTTPSLAAIRIAWAARTGHSVEQAAAAFETRYTDLGALGELQVRWNLGQIWSRAGLSGRDRSIVAISVLVTIGALPALAEQVHAARTLGLDDTEIREIVTHLGLYVGLPRATEAMMIVNEVLGAP